MVYSIVANITKFNIEIVNIENRKLKSKKNSEKSIYILTNHH